jgi:hypothetical protein
MAKRSRRARRQASEKQRQQAATPAVEPVSVEESAEVSASEVEETTAQTFKRSKMDFVKEYAYVYREMRNVFIIAVVMFAVLIGLSYVI